MSEIRLSLQIDEEKSNVCVFFSAIMLDEFEDGLFQEIENIEN